jgi:hypothetical protein
MAFRDLSQSQLCVTTLSKRSVVLPAPPGTIPLGRGPRQVAVDGVDASKEGPAWTADEVVELVGRKIANDPISFVAKDSRIGPDSRGNQMSIRRSCLLRDSSHETIPSEIR